MKRLSSGLGTTYQRFFENGNPNPAGAILNAGCGIPEGSIKWWDTRRMWSCDQYSLILVLEGATGFYQNEAGFHCKLAAGDVCFVFPHFKQYYGPGRDQFWSELFVAFSGELFESAERQGILQRESPVWHLKEPVVFEQQLHELLEQSPPTTATAQFKSAVSLLNIIGETLSGSESVSGHDKGGDWFAAACEIIDADLHHKPDWVAIAKQMGMSYHTFRLYFRQRSGLSPTQYRLQRRIERASTMLVEQPSLPYNQVAFILGFSNVQQFSEQFKRHTGQTPTAYQQGCLAKLSR